MIKKSIAFLSILSLSIFLPAFTAIPSPASAASIDGSKCSTIGATKKISGVIYQCSKRKTWKVLLKNSPTPSTASQAFKGVQKITPVSIPTLPPVPASKSFIMSGTKWPASKTDFTVALFGEPGEILDKSTRTLPIALQKLANATGNTFSILDTSNVPTPSIAAKTTCKDSYSDIDVIVIGMSKWDRQPPVSGGGNHGVTIFRAINKVFQCPIIKLNTEASDWSKQDFSTKGKSVGHTIMHEFGHAFGLAHPEDCAQVMKSCSIFVNEFGSGDLYGLYQLTQGQR